MPSGSPVEAQIFGQAVLRTEYKAQYRPSQAVASADRADLIKPTTPLRGATEGATLMNQFSPDDFDVDLVDRRVVHKPSGIWFKFYEYLNDEDWQKSDSITYRDNPHWSGDRMKLATEAKRAAILKGMKARRPAKA
jgi:hypothetical protein